MSPHGRALLVALALCCGCSTPAPEPPAATVRCSDAIDALPAPPDGTTVVADGVALVVGVLDLAPSPDGAPRFAKSPLVVRTDTAVDLRLAAPGRARLGWGSPAEFSTEVRVPACPATGGRWLVFAGGYVTDGPGCLAVTVRSGTDSTEVAVGLGRLC